LVKLQLFPKCAALPCLFIYAAFELDFAPPTSVFIVICKNANLEFSEN
jgi:hypothetical protein